jgi:hypothetical protein
MASEELLIGAVIGRGVQSAFTLGGFLLVPMNRDVHFFMR